VAEDAPALGVVDGQIDELDAALVEAPGEQRRHVGGARGAVALRPVGLGVPDEIGVPQLHAEVGQPHLALLPPDHAVPIVAHDDDRQIEPEPDGRLELLRVHHEPPVAADGDHLAPGVHQLGRDRRRQPRAHGRKRVVEQQRVGPPAAVVAGEPELVHAIVEAHDAVVRDRPPHLGHQPDGVNRQRRVGPLGLEIARQVSRQRRPCPVERRHVPVRLRRDPLGDAPHRVRDVAHHLDLREVDRVDLRRREVHVDDRPVSWAHHERRLLDDVVADVDDAVGRVDRAVDEVAVRERGAAEPERVGLVDDPLAHLGAQERYACAVDERAEHLGRELAVCARADHQQRAPRRRDRLDRLGHRALVRDRPPRLAGRQGRGVGVLPRDVLGQLEVRGAGALLLGPPERVADGAGHVVGRDQRPGVLGERAHHADDIDDLEMPLLAGLDRLLPGDHHHRHRAELGVGGGGDEVGGAGAERRQADARVAGQPPPGRRHEPRGLLVSRHNQPHAGVPQRLEQVEVLLARQPEHVANPLGLQRPGEQVGCFHDARNMGPAGDSPNLFLLSNRLAPPIIAGEADEDVELRHLRYFLAVAEALHFGRAARRLHVSQPTLSQQIMQLEQELGSPLFERRRQGTRLTQAGELFVRYASRALEDVSAGQAAVGALRGLEGGLLRVGYPPSLRGLAVPALSAVLTAYPGLRVSAEEAVVSRVERRLSAGKLDVGLGYAPTALTSLAAHAAPGAQAELEAEPLFDSRLGLVVPGNHPLASAGHVAARQLASSAFALLSRGLRGRARVDAYLASIRLSPRVVLESNAVAAVLAVVRAGLAVTILPEPRFADDRGAPQALDIDPELDIDEARCRPQPGAHAHAPARLVVLRLSPAPQADLAAVVWRKGAPRSPAAAAFAAELRARVERPREIT
jgi:LysR family transcriptional regulator, cyn operon transcriptional activator